MIIYLKISLLNLHINFNSFLLKLKIKWIDLYYISMFSIASYLTPNI